MVEIRRLGWNGGMNSPNRWNAVGDRLNDRLYDLVGACQRACSSLLEEMEWPDLTRRYFAEDMLSRPALERAARHVAAQNRVPAGLSEMESFLLGLRIHCALDFLGMVFPPLAQASPFGDVPPDWSDEALCEWLLIDLWNRRFDHWLKLDAVGSRGPFPFYGLEPVDRGEVS